jgi:hypothetical protein
VAPLTDSLRHLGRPVLTWPLALAACLSVSWMAQRLRNGSPDDSRHRV